MKVVKPVAAGQPVRWSDVVVDGSLTAVKIRREMERTFAPTQEAAA